MKHWQLAPLAPVDYVEALQAEGLHPVLAHLLWQRGYRSPQEALSFLAWSDLDDNPFNMKGMTEAVYRIRMAIRRGEPIAVYGDFDCDGVTSTVLLTGVLQKLGADVCPYIPNRVDEGYGLNSPALKSLAERGIKLVITVDCGVRSVQEVADANSYGLDVIISDHHSIGPELPPALAILNPKQIDCPYPEKMLAGVGLAYKIAQGLFMEAQRRGWKSDDPWRPDDWLDLVAIGTVADIAPLAGENRDLVRRGLLRLNPPARTGLRALYQVASLQPGRVNSTSIGFVIGPRINAAGRLRDASLAYNLLAAEDVNEAAALAQQLDALNQERQQKTLQMQQWAQAHFTTPEDEPLLFAADQRFEQGVVGLVASRLTEQHYKPSVIVQMGEHESHGSCRSIPEFHITHALDQCADLLERYGGHAAAAGFTVRSSNIEALQERLFDLAAAALAEEDLTPALNIDAELSLEALSPALADALARLEPTGEANPLPLLLTRDVTVRQRIELGEGGQHIKLMVGQEGAPTLEALMFRHKERFPGTNEAEQLDLVYHLEVNEWKGQRRLQLNVQDARPSG